MKITKLVAYPFYSEETLGILVLTMINISLYPCKVAGPYEVFPGQTPYPHSLCCILFVEKPVSQASPESQKPDTKIND